MGIFTHLSTCVDTQSPKYLEMAQGHISLSRASAISRAGLLRGWALTCGSGTAVTTGDFVRAQARAGYFTSWAHLSSAVFVNNRGKLRGSRWPLSQPPTPWKSWPRHKYSAHADMLSLHPFIPKIQAIRTCEREIGRGGN
jgi:hypothetical protein